jgi:hypothetical protein
MGKHIGGYPDLPPEPFTVDGETALDYRGADKLHQTVESIKLLSAWAAEQKYKARRRVNPKPARYGGDAAMRQLISNLASLWKDACKRPAGASAHQWTGEIGGPFVRFVQAFLDVLRESLDADDYTLTLSCQPICLCPQKVSAQFSADWSNQSEIFFWFGHLDQPKSG